MVVSRRDLLAIGGTAITIGVAGCSGNGENGNGQTDTTPENNETEQETEQEQEEEEQQQEEQGEGVIIVPEEHQYRQGIPLFGGGTVTFDFQQINEQHPIFQNTDHTDQPKQEIGLDTAPRIYHQKHIEELREASYSGYLTEIRQQLYNQELPNEIEKGPVIADYKDNTQDEETFFEDLPYEFFMNADSEKAALGIAHSLVWNAEYHLQDEAVSAVHGNPTTQLFGIEDIINNHPNDDLEIRISETHVQGNPRGLAYCKKDDEIRLIETSSSVPSSTPDDSQIHPKINESHYLYDDTEYRVDDALEQETTFDYEEIDKISNEMEKRRLTTQLYNLAVHDVTLQERSFDVAGGGFESGAVATPPGLLADLRQSILEYNEGNDVDFEEDIVPLANLVETLERESDTGEYFIVDYAPGNEYNGELNGDYMTDSVNVSTFEDVRTDIAGDTNHFFEN